MSRITGDYRLNLIFSAIAGLLVGTVIVGISNVLSDSEITFVFTVALVVSIFVCVYILMRYDL